MYSFSLRERRLGPMDRRLRYLRRGKGRTTKNELVFRFSVSPFLGHLGGPPKVVGLDPQREMHCACQQKFPQGSFFSQKKTFPNVATAQQASNPQWLLFLRLIRK